MALAGDGWQSDSGRHRARQWLPPASSIVTTTTWAGHSSRWSSQRRSIKEIAELTWHSENDAETIIRKHYLVSSAAVERIESRARNVNRGKWRKTRNRTVKSYSSPSYGIVR